MISSWAETTLRLHSHCRFKCAARASWLDKSGEDWLWELEQLGGELEQECLEGIVDKWEWASGY